MEAEKELSAIFSKSKNGMYNREGNYTFFSPDLSYSSCVSCPSSNYEDSNSKVFGKNSDSAEGFSNFGHFKAPIKRPSCNPIVKDERFKRLNTVNEGNLGCLERPKGPIPCDSQVVMNPFLKD